MVNSLLVVIFVWYNLITILGRKHFSLFFMQSVVIVLFIFASHPIIKGFRMYHELL